ncbi:diaminopimelate decarboxylase [Dysgonomonas sp. PH5-45]|uniref:diaminopimelate decarboxylase n=1 Tax=unclassified Dysgonomonas TaxID=2630389 RepID=UPI00247447DF|nr:MULTISPECIES: diaminopimelate decarboxylase [unclassified Dysgonomonas]MDH6354202.1 diaminopimelate decarboxylase [Dysgonomonas sp. PH5-45]MDH6387103.1 diaminopimelate decarboxylase [Dysgonomonas sp. PH5-37]
MTKGIFPVDKFRNIETPFYYYDINILKQTLQALKAQTQKYSFVQHYAVKANANPYILQIIATAGFGADCVSGNEIKAAINAGFPGSKIVFAGVGKTDKEIGIALDHNIFCFNVESLPELEAINSLAGKKGKKASVAIRINPNVDAHTHEYITTGLNENKFGFSIDSLPTVIEALEFMNYVELIGIHFHIGSQITDIESFESLCHRVNDLQAMFQEKGIKLPHINVGGGMGIDYETPDSNLIPDFAALLSLFHNNLELRQGQIVHLELGRSVVGQCGSLISRVTYVKVGNQKKFVILDAGMTDFIRPALYQAQHKIENISSDKPLQTYDVVGPICESADCFAKDYPMNETERGNLIAIRSAGAYGEVMVSQYNCRETPKSYFSDKI